MARLITAASVVLTVGSCDAGDEQASSSDRREPQDLAIEGGPVVQWLPFEGGAFDLLPEDIDGNGLLDIAITAHGESYTQIFYQTQPRRFEPSAPTDEVGFHPGDLLRVPVPDDNLYLMNAEGENAIMVFTPRGRDEFSAISELAAPAPRTATFFDWPGHGLGLALAPFGQDNVLVIEDFQPRAGKRGPAYRLPLASGLSRVHHLTSGDIDSDGSDEVLYVDAWTAELYSISEADEGQIPTPDLLWSIEDRARISKVQIGDLDRNGTPDLVIPEEVAPRHPARPPRVHILLTREDGAFDTYTIDYPTALNTDDGSQPRGFRSVDVRYSASGQQTLMALTTEHELVLFRLPAGWAGDPPAAVRLPFAHRSATRRSRLVDVDGDGLLDLVLGLSHPRGNGQILYGPLWEGLSDASGHGLTLDDLPQPPATR